MLKGQEENSSADGLVALLGQVLDSRESIDCASTLYRQLKDGDLFHLLVQKTIESAPRAEDRNVDHTLIEFVTSYTCHPDPPLFNCEYQYGLRLTCITPATLAVGVHFSLSFLAIDRVGEVIDKFEGSECEVVVEGEVVESRRLGHRNWDGEILKGKKHCTLQRGKGGIFRGLSFTVPSSRVHGGTFTLLIICRRDRRLKPLRLTDVEVLSALSSKLHGVKNQQLAKVERQ